MKACKVKSILFAGIAIVTVAILCLGWVPAVAFASDVVNLRKGNANNFVYSAEFSDVSDGAALVFGASEDLASYWAISANVTEGKLELLQKEAVLKTARYSFNSARLALTVVVNEGIVKVFAGGSDVAIITCKLDGYSSGRVGVKEADSTVTDEQFASTDTPDGDIFCNGYSVLKVVNVTDGRKLGDSDYSINKGVLTVSREYLKTLEADTEYTFRVVTSFTDLDFKLTPDFTAATATSVFSKYYRGSAVTFELSGSATVYMLLIDGNEVDFTQNGNRVVVSSEVVDTLATGQHKAKLYTDYGRPEATFTVSEPVVTLTEMEPEATHTFFWIDIAIFGTLILAYVAFTVVKKLNLI